MNYPFYIARRYLFSRKSHHAINIISGISVMGVAIATMALVCTLSVFNGFQDLIASLFTAFDPQLRVSLVEGRSVKADDPVLMKLKASPLVDIYTPVMEDQALVVRDDHQYVVTIKGNRQYGLRGPLVSGQFKNAAKQKGQKVRENYIYICNNPVVKHAVPRAERYRWNFLAYMHSSHPFSEEILPGTESETMRQVLSNVRTRKNRGRPVDYLFFGGSYTRLDEREKRQVIDYIVSEYNVLDYETAKREWGDYEKICQVLSTVSGSEYDIAEEKTPEDYRHYYRMIRLAAREGYDLSAMRMTGIGLDELNRLAGVFREEAGATQAEIAKFLHAPFLR